MPSYLKTIISLLALALTVAVFVIDTRAGAGVSRWVSLALGPLMVFSIWIFPEAKARDIRKEAAARR